MTFNRTVNVQISGIFFDNVLGVYVFLLERVKICLVIDRWVGDIGGPFG